jgi:hypothetical protein
MNCYALNVLGAFCSRSIKTIKQHSSEQWNLKKLIRKGKNYLDFLRLEQTKEALRFKEEGREKRTDGLLSRLGTPFSGIPDTIAHIASLQ